MAEVEDGLGAFDSKAQLVKQPEQLGPDEAIRSMDRQAGEHNLAADVS
jgi:hypothetical protein